MKIARYFLGLMLCAALFISISGCREGAGNQHGTAREAQGRQNGNDAPAVSVQQPSPFVAQSPEDLINFINEINAQVPVSETRMFRTIGEFYTRVRDRNRWAYASHEVASLTEIYLVEIEGFELAGLEISRNLVGYSFGCVEEGHWGDEVFIAILRPSRHGYSPDEVWQIVSEQMLEFGGVLTELGMIYNSDANQIRSRIGDTYFSIRVPDRLNNYEFLRDLALEVIERSELIVIDHPLED
ncbi:MAG: hypothetical protein FWB75_04745 [Oscillospiraceae bacterium]|nr:hypothetical protein [Oscillospiraceae bacterium]MCL2201253.1 hypothetical protein [Oscillospiraceae bacterium]